MIRVWFWFASPQMRELQNDADLLTTTRVTFASVPPGRQLTSVDVVKPGPVPEPMKTYLDAMQATR